MEDALLPPTNADQFTSATRTSSDVEMVLADHKNHYVRSPITLVRQTDRSDVT